jgi:hypothetical protein
MREEHSASFDDVYVIINNETYKLGTIKFFGNYRKYKRQIDAMVKICQDREGKIRDDKNNAKSRELNMIISNAVKGCTG